MRYANWDVVADSFDERRNPPFDSWARREGPREAARRQPTFRGRNYGEDHATFARSFEDLKKPGPVLVVGCVREVMSDIGLIRDWHRSVAANARADLPAAEFDALPVEARAVAMTARRTLRRLSHMTFAEAKAASDTWHREEVERRHEYIRLLSDPYPPAYPRRTIFDVSGINWTLIDPLAPAVGEGERHPVEGLPGHYWTRLETRDAYWQESARMAHCVGWESQDYAKKYLGKAYPEGIWSLRHGDGSLLTAEVAVVVRPNTISALINGVKDAQGLAGTRCPNGFQVRIVQVRAAHNHPVPPKYAAAVRWLEGLRVAPEGMGRAA